MPEKQEGAHPEYIGYIDSVRGIAILFVILGHFFNHRFHEHSVAKLLSYFVNNETAIFLFVLSGFVLSYKYLTLGYPLDIRKFYIQRFLRLWPAFFVAILVCALYQYRHDLGFENLVNQFVFDQQGFWEEASLLRYSPGFNPNPRYNIPGWALVIILSMSFLVPFMIALAHRNIKYLYWMLVAFMLIGNNPGPKYVYHIHFALGVILAYWFKAINAGELKKYNWYRYRHLILAGAFILFSMRQIGRINKIVFFGPEYKYWVHDFLGIDFSLYSGIASFVFLVAIIDSGKAKRFLDNRLLRFTGKISFGLYLMHWVFVLAVFDHWLLIVKLFPNTVIAMMVMIVAYTIVVGSLATLLHYTVELPSIRFAKRVTARLKPSLVISKES